tara:strand:- start:618 stop:1019 length:402 start_codon:yes stop_codon:yes gene_type:complete
MENEKYRNVTISLKVAAEEKIIIKRLTENNNVTLSEFLYNVVMCFKGLYALIGRLKTRLKNGEIIDYKFGDAKANDEYEMSKEFFDWFDSCPPAKNIINKFIPNKNEEKCVKGFYLKNIEPFKDIKTDTTVVK